MDVQKLPKGPLLHFSALCDFRRPKKIRNFFFNFFLTRVLQKRILDTLKSFCYFWALDMAPTWVVPGLFECWATKILSSFNVELEDFIRHFPELSFDLKKEIFCRICAWSATLFEHQNLSSFQSRESVTPKLPVSWIFSKKAIENYSFIRASVTSEDTISHLNKQAGTSPNWRPAHVSENQDS